jgi:hypothetical protein
MYPDVYSLRVGEHSIIRAPLILLLLLSFSFAYSLCINCIYKVVKKKSSYRINFSIVELFFNKRHCKG